MIIQASQIGYPCGLRQIPARSAGDGGGVRRRVRPGPDADSSTPNTPTPPATWLIQRDGHRNVDRHACRRRGAGVFQSRVRNRRQFGALDAAPLGHAGQFVACRAESRRVLDRRVYITWTRRAQRSVHRHDPRCAAVLARVLREVRPQTVNAGQLQVIRRWTTAPNFYINTFNPRTESGHPAQRAGFVVAARSEARCRRHGRALPGRDNRVRVRRPSAAGRLHQRRDHLRAGQQLLRQGKRGAESRPNLDQLRSVRQRMRRRAHLTSHAHARNRPRHGTPSPTTRAARGLDRQPRGLCQRNFSGIERYPTSVLYSRPLATGHRLGPADERPAHRRVSRADRQLPPLTPPAPPPWPWPGAWCILAACAHSCSFCWRWRRRVAAGPARPRRLRLPPRTRPPRLRRGRSAGRSPKR